MLCRLLISDFVLVERLSLDFSEGFGALTGETGAGKSILLDALSLLLGERADAAVVRESCERAEVAAEFALPDGAAVYTWLAEQDLFEGPEILLRRVVERSGRSRAYVNGRPVTATQLRELGDFLADIHGQHAHQALLRADAQRRLLDEHADLLPLTAQVGSAWQVLTHAREALARATEQAAELNRERDFLQFQLAELGELSLQPEAWASLNQEHARLANASGLQSGVAQVLDALSEHEQALQGQSVQMAGRLGELAQLDPALQEVAELLSAAAIQLDEAAHALRRYQDKVELDPERLESVEQQLSAWHGAARKYRVQPEALAALQTEAQKRLNELSALADPDALAQQVQTAQAAYRALAEDLSAKRQMAAQRLSVAVTEAMQTLAMAGGRFDVALLADPAGSAQGLERVEFQVAANAGQPLRALVKVASGGELSRIGLAIQVIVSATQSVPTLIFDEVDVGIGGGVAEIVGRRLRELGTSRQVLCVTHLPQVAAQATWQWRVSKKTQAGVSLSQLEVLDQAGRVEEIARMLGGVNITATTRSHAAELLGVVL